VAEEISCISLRSSEPNDGRDRFLSTSSIITYHYLGLPVIPKSNVQRSYKLLSSRRILFHIMKHDITTLWALARIHIYELRYGFYYKICED
jgi:hypothetical protein